MIETRLHLRSPLGASFGLRTRVTGYARLARRMFGKIDGLLSMLPLRTRINVGEHSPEPFHRSQWAWRPPERRQ